MACGSRNRRNKRPGWATSCVIQPRLSFWDPDWQLLPCLPTVLPSGTQSHGVESQPVRTWGGEGLSFWRLLVNAAVALRQTGCQPHHPNPRCSCPALDTKQLASDHWLPFLFSPRASAPALPGSALQTWEPMPFYTGPQPVHTGRYAWTHV